MTYAGPILALPGDHIRPRRHLSLCVYVYSRTPNPSRPYALEYPYAAAPRAQALWAELPRPRQATPGARMAEMPTTPIGIAATDPAPGSTPVGGWLYIHRPPP